VGSKKSALCNKRNFADAMRGRKKKPVHGAAVQARPCVLYGVRLMKCRRMSALQASLIVESTSTIPFVGHLERLTDRYGSNEEVSQGRGRVSLDTHPPPCHSKPKKKSSLSGRGGQIPFLFPFSLPLYCISPSRTGDTGSGRRSLAPSPRTPLFRSRRETESRATHSELPRRAY